MRIALSIDPARLATLRSRADRLRDEAGAANARAGRLRVSLAEFETALAGRSAPVQSDMAGMLGSWGGGSISRVDTRQLQTVVADNAYAGDAGVAEQARYEDSELQRHRRELADQEARAAKASARAGIAFEVVRACETYLRGAGDVDAIEIDDSDALPHDLVELRAMLAELAGERQKIEGAAIPLKAAIDRLKASVEAARTGPGVALAPFTQHDGGPTPRLSLAMWPVPENVALLLAARFGPDAVLAETTEQLRAWYAATKPLALTAGERASRLADIERRQLSLGYHEEIQLRRMWRTAGEDSADHRSDADPRFTLALMEVESDAA